MLRRTIGPSLSLNTLNDFENTLKTYNSRFMDTLKKVTKETNGIVDMNDWFNRFSFDVISIMNDLMGNRLQERLLLGRILGR